MKCDNRSVRKRNQKEVATMMTGIKATAYAAFNLAGCTTTASGRSRLT